MPTLRPAPLDIPRPRGVLGGTPRRRRPPEPRVSERYPRRRPAPGVPLSRLGAARRALGGNRRHPPTPNSPRSSCAAPRATCAKRAPHPAWGAAPGAGKSLRAATATDPLRPCRRPHLHAPLPLAFHPCVEIPRIKKKIFFRDMHEKDEGDPTIRG